MKKLIPFILFLLLIPVQVVSLEIKVEPNEVWIGDDVRISCWYNEITTPPVLLAFIEKTPSTWQKQLNKLNDTYYWVNFTPPRTPPLLGTYKVFCSDGATNSSQVTFRVSSLNVSIMDYPNNVYLGNPIMLQAKVTEKSDAEQIISGGVDFKLSLNSKNVPINPDATFFFNGKWTITTEALSLTGFSPGSHKLLLEATYKANKVYDERNVDVKPPMEFELISIDKTWVRSNDNITFTFKALYEGNLFEFKKEYLRIWIDSIDVEIKELYQSGIYTYVKTSVPNRQPDTYDLDIRFTYMDFIKDIHRTIDYVVPVSGTVKDSDDKAVYVQLNFRNDQTQKMFVTDSSGSYSGFIPPGIYTLELTFPDSKLILDDIMINEFDNPVKFDHPSTEVNIPGIGVGAIFVYEIALTYSDAYLEMKYDDSKIVDENQISVYRCENWNFGRKICNSVWEIVDAEVDTVRNYAKLNTTELSTFVIGYKKNLNLDFDVDKEEYFLREIIKIIGIVEDNDKKPVSDSTVTVNIPNTDIAVSTKSGDTGVFSMEFLGPDKEGVFTLNLKAEKPPFSSANSSKSIKILRSKQFSIVISESIKIKQGEDISIPFQVVNTGQTDFSNLKLRLTGIPDGYCILSKNEIPQLNAGNQDETFIQFKIPEDASKTSYTASLKVEWDGDSSEEQFILTILSNETNETVASEEGGFKFPNIGLPTAKIVLPGLSIDVLLIVIVGISSFSIAAFLKMRKNPNLIRKVEVKTQLKPENRLKRENIRNLLLDIRREINRNPIKETKLTNKLKRKMRKK